jgi:hypothetical protein
MIITFCKQKHNTAKDTQIVNTILTLRLILVLSVQWEKHKKNVPVSQRQNKILYVHKNRKTS